MKRVTIVFLALLLSGCMTNRYGSRAGEAGSFPRQERVSGEASSDVHSAPVQSVSLSSSTYDSAGADVPTSSADKSATLLHDSIYFAFDSFQIAPQYQEILLNDVGYLRSHPQESIRIVGNTDERGSRSYNLALGQKRAEVIRQTFVTMGIDPSRVEAVSFGKEKPKATGHDEEAWAKNRRSDFLYKSLGEF